MSKTEYEFRETGTYDGVAYDIKAHSEAELGEKVGRRKSEINQGKQKISKQLCYQKSDKNYAIQAADIVAGTIRHEFIDNKRKTSKKYKLPDLFIEMP